MIAPLLAAIVAFLLFGCATERHHRRRWGRPCPRARALAMRTGGWTGLALGFGLAMAARGPVVGPIAWVATLMVAAAVSFCVLNLAPRRAVQADPRRLSPPRPPAAGAAAAG